MNKVHNDLPPKTLKRPTPKQVSSCGDKVLKRSMLDRVDPMIEDPSSCNSTTTPNPVDLVKLSLLLNQLAIIISLIIKNVLELCNLVYS